MGVKVLKVAYAKNQMKSSIFTSNFLNINTKLEITRKAKNYFLLYYNWLSKIFNFPKKFYTIKIRDRTGYGKLRELVKINFS